MKETLKQRKNPKGPSVTSRGQPFLDRLALCLSTWFGAGLLPLAPGTFGSLAGLPLAAAISLLELWLKTLVAVVFLALAVWSADIHSAVSGRRDPPQAVIDEVAGLIVSVSFFPFSWFNMTAGFILFRLFDIMKPPPIKAIEGLEGGIGIVGDDLVAGIYAMGVLLVLRQFFS